MHALMRDAAGLTMTDVEEMDGVFDSAADLFRLLSTPIRLKIISAVCHGERNVSELLAQIDTTQPNMSQHLATLYRAGVLGKRREGTQIFYRLDSPRVAELCRAVCTQVAVDLEQSQAKGPNDQRLVVPRR